mmetsp:Transcript_53605/g.149117  ORF Transcript_53605/g.149117 Transcript_53605/m.149117 type:complete len:235 (-) Transcript_53605:1856-2560(-)
MPSAVCNRENCANGKPRAVSGRSVVQIRSNVSAESSKSYSPSASARISSRPSTPSPYLSYLWNNACGDSGGFWTGAGFVDFSLCVLASWTASDDWRAASWILDWRLIIFCCASTRVPLSVSSISARRRRRKSAHVEHAVIAVFAAASAVCNAFIASLGSVWSPKPAKARPPALACEAAASAKDNKRSASAKILPDGCPFSMDFCRVSISCFSACLLCSICHASYLFRCSKTLVT